MSFVLLRDVEAFLSKLSSEKHNLNLKKKEATGCTSRVPTKPVKFCRPRESSREILGRQQHFQKKVWSTVRKAKPIPLYDGPPTPANGKKAPHRSCRDPYHQGYDPQIPYHEGIYGSP